MTQVQTYVLPNNNSLIKEVTLDENRVHELL